MKQISQSSAHSEMEALRSKWTTLYATTLPTLARSKSPAQPYWPVTLDHCFARIILDNTVGGGTNRWDEVIRKPAVRNMSEEQLRAAIELGEEIQEGKTDLVDLDAISLACRGKNEMVERKARGRSKKADKKQEDNVTTIRKRKQDDTTSHEQSPPKKHKTAENHDSTIKKEAEPPNPKSPKPKQQQSRQGTLPFSSPTKTKANPFPSNNSPPHHPNPDTELNLTKIATHPTLTPFRKRLYSTLLSVPPGHYTTYASLAKHLSSCARAVGSGMRHNPFAPGVPCHRVLAADGSLGGFHGDWGEEGKFAREKKELLAGEGVRFDSRGKVKGPVFDGLRDLSRVEMGDGEVLYHRSAEDLGVK